MCAMCVAVLQTYRDLAWFCPQSTAAVCHAIEGCDDLPQDDEVEEHTTCLFFSFFSMIYSVGSSVGT